MEIRLFKTEDRKQVMELLVKTFSHLMQDFLIPAYADSLTNYKKSIVISKDDEIIGFYLLGYRPLCIGIADEGVNNVYVDLDDYNDLHGLEGVALVIKEAYRGQGLGSQLKDYVKTLDVEYVWGLQYKELGNLEHWLKRRILAGENDEINITVEKFA